MATRPAGATLRFKRLSDAVRGFITHSKATPIVCSVGVPPLSPCSAATIGGSERSIRSMIERLNAALPDLCANTGAVLFDSIQSAMVELVGSATWFDTAFYNLYRLPFAPDAVELYADGPLAGCLGRSGGRAENALSSTWTTPVRAV